MGRGLLFAILVAATLGCGVRTDPRPPEDTMARAPEDAGAKGFQGGVRVRWKRPTRAVDGESLYDLAAFIVQRRTDQGEFEPIARIPVNDSDDIRPQQSFTYDDHDPPYGTLTYRVFAVTSDGQRGLPSDEVPVEAADGPAR
jgi:hypothetical protein